MDVVGKDRVMVALRKEDEYRQVFDTFYTPLCIFANRYVENDELAADIVQDIFVKLWQLREDFFYLHQVKSFLYTAVRNRSLNELEHTRVTAEYAQKTLHKESDSFFRDHIIEQETFRILVDAIHQLPEQAQKVMLLALDGFNNQEIANSLQVSTETVHTHKKIAYRKLRDKLKGYYYHIFLLL